MNKEFKLFRSTNSMQHIVDGADGRGINLFIKDTDASDRGTPKMSVVGRVGRKGRRLRTQKMWKGSEGLVLPSKQRLSRQLI